MKDLEREKVENKLNALSPFKVILTFFRYVFMLMSTPAMVPCTMVPFFSSTVTVSLLSFMRNL